MKEIKTGDRQALEMMNHITQDAHASIKTKDAVLLQKVDTERLSIRLKPARTINERLTKGTPASRGSDEPKPGGSANQALAKVSVIKPAASIIPQTATLITTEQVAPKQESAQISPRTLRAVEQATAIVVGQGARIARQSTAGAASSVTGIASSSQRVPRRSDPRVKGAPALKLLKRGVVQVGRGVKYAANKTADQISKDPSTSRSDPDKVVGDLAIRQAQALVSNAAQAAARKAAETAARKAAQVAGRIAAKLGAQAAKLAMKIAMALIQAAAKAISALVASTGPVGVVISS